MSKAQSWTFVVGVMVVIAVALVGISMIPVAINLRTPPSRGVSTDIRFTVATIAAAAVIAIGLGYGIAADRHAARRKTLAITGTVLMVAVGAALGLVALFLAGF